MLESTCLSARCEVAWRRLDMLISTVLLLMLFLAAGEIADFILGLPETIFHGYSSLLRWAADSVHTLFDTYGYWVVFCALLAENTLFFGLVVPGLLVVVLAGLAAENGAMSLPIAAALGIAGTIIGDTISYFMGRFGWTRLVPTGSIREFMERVREPILRRGPLFVLVYHFAGYTRLVGPASAGLLQMPYRRWAPADYAGASLWVCSYMAIGYGLGLLGFSLDSTDDWFRYLEWGLLVVVMIWGYFLLRAGQRAFAEHLSPGDDDAEAEDEPVVSARS